MTENIKHIAETINHRTTRSPTKRPNPLGHRAPNIFQMKNIITHIVENITHMSENITYAVENTEYMDENMTEHIIRQMAHVANKAEDIWNMAQIRHMPENISRKKGLHFG